MGLRKIGLGLVVSWVGSSCCARCCTARGGRRRRRRLGMLKWTEAMIAMMRKLPTTAAEANRSCEGKEQSFKTQSKSFNESVVDYFGGVPAPLCAHVLGLLAS